MSSDYAMLIDFMQKFPSYIPAVLIYGLVAFILYRAHIGSNNKFTVFDLIEGESGRGSLEKVGLLTGMISLTWWFLDMIAQGKATWEVASAFGTMMGLYKIANKYIDSKTSSNSGQDQSKNVQ